MQFSLFVLEMFQYPITVSLLFFYSIISCYVDTVKSHLLALLYFPLNIFCSFSKLYKKCISMGESAECVHFLLYLLPDGRCSFSARKRPV